MAQVPVSMNVVVYPKNKTVAPYPATIVGYAWITGLSVGGGPATPPPEMGKPPEIWPPGSGIDMPSHPIELPPVTEPPPVDPPPQVVKPFPDGGGWGYSPQTGWVYKPGSGTAGPKK